jgi:hypothetical protein
VIFYRGGLIDTLMASAKVVSNKIGDGDQYVIMSQREWRKIFYINPNFATPLLTSEGTGPEGDSRLVLFKGEVPFISDGYHYKR